MKKISVLLVDDHTLVREGIKNSLVTQEHIQIVGEAKNGLEALDILKKSTPDVVIMDVNMPIMNGTETTKSIKRLYPDINIIVLTMHNEEALISELLQSGATGYLLKSTSMAELVEAIEVVSGGETYFTKEVALKMMNRFVKGTGRTKALKAASLTKREVEILKLISEEYTNHEIADMLFISPRTVDTHRRNLIQKLHAKNTAGLVRYAIRNNIAEI
ncbi:hypothetical protein BFP97_05485 [Roseivirga sp. 4D4]|uniref:response regulator n=1 Tax=Roseivirga sp. 4D4 TaxID=1889784 RepID=UPI000852F983|nr:response regulator transcription factor [Roseivirga sp. 4D4]OEK00995.1 hypothetical protein BFP97_05485 [Roseivirga sp. 4D4]